MVRGIIVGALAFAVAFAAERVIAGMQKDIDRYDAMRKMSGEEPLPKEVLATVGSLFSGSMDKSAVSSLIDSLTNDAVRYAKMRGM